MDAQNAKQLWEKYLETGAMEDRWAIIEGNAGLVGSVVRSFVGQGLSYDELLSEGQMGLVLAVDKFKTELGSDVSFARSWSAFAREWIVGQILNAIKNLHKRLNKSSAPADYELEIEFKAEPVGSGMERSEVWQEVQRAVNAKEAKAITLVFREGLTYREAAEQLGCKFNNLHYLITSGLKKCRESGALEDFREAK